MKQNVMFQGRMQHEINQLNQIRNGRHARYLVNRARWLDHYCITKCEVSGETVP